MIFCAGSTSLAQTDTCIYILTSSAASCDTCCDACLDVVTTGDCPDFAIQWIPDFLNCQACASVTYTALIYTEFGETIYDSITVGTEPVNLNITKVETENKFKVYPNPVLNNIKIVLSLEKEYQNISLIIYNILGEKICEIPYSENNISVGFLKKGIYVIAAVSNNQVLARSKFIKE